MSRGSQMTIANVYSLGRKVIICFPFSVLYEI
jgi:hypothetical protein